MKNELKIILATALFGIAFVAVPASAGNEGPNSYFEWGEQNIGQSFNKVTFSQILLTLELTLMSQLLMERFMNQSQVHNIIMIQDLPFKKRA